jgi:hypothetical protein
LALESVAFLFVVLQGGVGIGVEICASRLEDLEPFSFSFLLQTYLPLVQHADHPLLERGLVLEQFCSALR